MNGKTNEHGAMAGGNHAALWRGRFSDGPDADAVAFETSIHVDARMAEDDIRGSKAHAEMLARAGLVSRGEADAIIKGLDEIAAELASGALKIDASAEDIHSFIEATLTDKIGEAGKKIHTGRSRNDQIALDERLYLRRAIPALRKKIAALVGTLASIAEQNISTLMPGFTHLQHAQVVTLAHHLCAWAWSFTRDAARLDDALSRISLSPIGAGALAGSSLPLDRNFEAALLGFDGVTQNSLDTVSDRDYLLELSACLSIVQMHLSRCSEEIVLWASSEFSFVDLSEKWSTGSSIMPQKKNPDFAELIRGRTGKVYGDMTALFVMMKGLPLAYDRDMQEDKESFFDALDTVDACLSVFIKMISSAKWNAEKMAESCEAGFLCATDAAEYLVKKGLPFRTAHEKAAKAVRLAIEKKCGLEQLSLEEWKSCSAFFEDDIYAAVNPAASVAAHKTAGGPAPEQVKRQIAELKRFAESGGSVGGNAVAN